MHYVYSTRPVFLSFLLFQVELSQLSFHHAEKQMCIKTVVKTVSFENLTITIFCNYSQRIVNDANYSVLPPTHTRQQLEKYMSAVIFFSFISL